MHANIAFDGDIQPHLYINAHECVHIRVGAATETKFDCREAKGLFLYAANQPYAARNKRRCVSCISFSLARCPEGRGIRGLLFRYKETSKLVIITLKKQGIINSVI